MGVISQYSVRSERDGTMLSVLKVSPESRIRGVLQMAHGMAEHKERYTAMMQFLADRGYVCVMNDHRGHGASVASEKDLGYFGKDGANALVDDLHQITTALRKEYPGVPLYLYGHSMGSLAVRVYRNRYEADIDGLIVCGSPGQNPAADAGIRLIKLLTVFKGGHGYSKLITKMTGGMSARFANEGSPFAWLSTVHGEVEKYEKDPLCGFPFKLNGYQALMELMKQAYMPAKTAKPDMPVHFLSGADDPCMPDKAGFENAVNVMRANGCARVTSKLYEGRRHEIHNEDIREQVYADIADLLDGWNTK